MRQLAEPVVITGRKVTQLKLSASVGVVLMIGFFAAAVRLSGGDGPGTLSGGLIPFTMLVLGVIVIRATTAAVNRLIFRMRPPHLGSRVGGDLGPSMTALRPWIAAFLVLVGLWWIGVLGPPLVASAICVCCGCLGWVWALQARVTAVDPRQPTEDERKAARRLSVRLRREANILLSQWLSGISTLLGIALIACAIATVASPLRLHIWRWALLFTLAYVILGSLLRAAAETSNHLWIDIDVVRLWKVSRKTFIIAGAATGIGAAIGALVSCFIWLSGHLGASGEALDMIGRWVTAGTALGAVAGVLTVPKLAFIRRRELRREDHDRLQARSHQPRTTS